MPGSIGIKDLPEELLQLILQHLPSWRLASIQETSKRFQTAALRATLAFTTGTRVLSDKLATKIFAKLVNLRTLKITLSGFEGYTFLGLLTRLKSLHLMLHESEFSSLSSSWSTLNQQILPYLVKMTHLTSLGYYLPLDKEDLRKISALKQLKSLTVLTTAISVTKWSLSTKLTALSINVARSMSFKPRFLTKLTQLKSLQIFDPDPSADYIAKLPLLEELSIVNRTATDLPQLTWISLLTNLKSFTASKMTLSNMSVVTERSVNNAVQHLTSLQSLTRLHLDNLLLYPISAGTFTQLTKLTNLQHLDLGLCHGKITDLPREVLTAFPYLSMNLTDTDFWPINQQVEIIMPRLRELVLVGEYQSAFIFLQHYQKLSNLLSLDYFGTGRNNTLCSKVLDFVFSITQLHELSLTSCQIKHEHYRSLNHLQRLRYLHLGNTTLTNELLDCIVNLSNLTQLEFRRCQLRDITSDDLIKLTALQNLENMVVLLTGNSPGDWRTRSTDAQVSDAILETFASRAPFPITLMKM